jgi:hypothetical protein
VRMLDLFCGRLGWSRAFAARGWECVGVDLVEPPEIPQGCRFIKYDVLGLELEDGFIHVLNEYGMPEYLHPDFICASSPCEQFSVHGMKHFHPNPPYPELGIKLFNHTRELCEASGVPYVMENVRAAQQFVGNARHHCGPFYLWGSGVPPLMNQGIGKGTKFGLSRERRRTEDPTYKHSSGTKMRKELTAGFATIPPELANCVADYAERICGVEQETKP